MTSRDFPATAAGAKRALALDGAEPSVVAPRLASTVLLLRDDEGPLEVFMMRRAATMDFAPSMHVFPGGAVDLRDDDNDLPWRGPSAEEWAETLGTDASSARLLVAAAVREIFEETGVLLASGRAECEGEDPIAPVEDGGVCGISRDQVSDLRRALVAREVALADVLRGHDLLLRSDLLTYRAHWITPESEPIRYDTRFFLAEVPAGQDPDGATEEAELAQWVRPAEVLTAHERGEVLLLPPTMVSLEQLADAGSVSEALRQQVAVAPVLPRWVQTDAGPAVRADLP